MSVLEVRNLHTSFFLPTRTVRALRGISFEIGQGETVGLVGESGSGKSVTAASILGLVRPPGRIVEGEVIYGGLNLVGAPEARLRTVRGREIGLVVQNPRAALNPLVTVGDQLVNIFRSHFRTSKKDARVRCLEMLEAVGIGDAEQRAQAYPHELSGGTAQRVLIAAALLPRPRLLLADEPTTALDVTIQIQILNLLRDSVRDTGSSSLLITHDLGVVAHYCQRTLVMHDGVIVESGPTEQLFASPSHWYSRKLISMSRDDRDEWTVGIQSARKGGV